MFSGIPSNITANIGSTGGLALDTTLQSVLTDLNKMTFVASRLLVDGSGVVQPVSGTVVANIGSTGGVALDTTLGAMSAKLPASLGPQAMALSLSVTVSSDQTPIPVTVSGATIITSENINEWGGAPTSLGQKPMLTSVPVTIASDQSALLSAQSGNWDIRNITGAITLPAGAATAANQGTEIASLASIDGKLAPLGQALMNASMPVAIAANQTAIPVTGTFWQATQPVSGTVAVSGTVTVSGTVVADIGTTGGLALDSTLGALSAKFGPLGQALMNSSAPVVIASNQTAIPSSQSGSWSVALLAGASTIGSVGQAGSWNVTLLAGASTIGAVDQAGVWNVGINAGANTIGSVNQAGVWSVGLSTGSNTIGSVNQAGLWSVGLTAGSTVIANAGTGTFTTSDAADGPVAPGAVAAKSVLVGAQFNSILPTLGGGQQAALQADSSGRLLVGSIASPLPSGTNVIGHVVVDSGTITANQGGAPWSQNVTQFGGSAVVTGTGVGGAGIPRVTISSDSNILATQSGTWTVQQGSAPWSQNITQFGGSPIATGTGISGAGIPRVTVANDSNVLATQSGTWTVQQGAVPTAITNAWPFKITDGTNVAGVDAANHLFVSGKSAVGVAPSANPIYISGVDGGGLKRGIATDTAGHVEIVGPFAPGAAANPNPVLIGGRDDVGNAQTVAVDDIFNQNSMYVTATPIEADLTKDGKFYQSVVEFTLPTNATETPFFYIKNPTANTLLLYIDAFQADVITKGQQATFRAYTNPTVTVNGTAVTIVNTLIQAGSPASVMQAFSGPTVTANGTKVRVFSVGTNSNSQFVSNNFALIIAPNNSMLITGTPTVNNLVVSFLIQWSESL